MKRLEEELELESCQTSVLEPIITGYETCTPNAREYIYSIIGTALVVADKRNYSRKTVFDVIAKRLNDFYRGIKKLPFGDDQKKGAELVLGVLQAQILKQLKPSYNPFKQA